MSSQQTGGRNGGVVMDKCLTCGQISTCGCMHRRTYRSLSLTSSENLSDLLRDCYIGTLEEEKMLRLAICHILQGRELFN